MGGGQSGSRKCRQRENNRYGNGSGGNDRNKQKEKHGVLERIEGQGVHDGLLLSGVLV